MKPKLSYANVMATLAVFIALGGTGYAVSQINGSQIVDRSISGKKLKRGAITANELAHNLVVPRAVLSDQTQNLLISHPRKRAHRLAADTTTPASPTIVTLSVGQSATVLQSGRSPTPSFARPTAAAARS